MQTKLAGRLPLQDMINSVLAESRQKLAAAEDESKAEEKKEKKVEKLVEYEKKEHGGKIPSVKEEEAEHKKESSAFDFSNPDEIAKLASALDHVSDLLKVADKVELGGESHQGGMVLPTAVPPKGVQPYKHDASKKHNVPMNPGTHSDPSQGSASTQMENNIHKAPGGGGTQKETTASVSDIDATLAKVAGMDKEALSPKTLGSYLAKRGVQQQAREGIVTKGLAQYAPSNLKKAIKSAVGSENVDRGIRVGKALHRAEKARGLSPAQTMGGFVEGIGSAHKASYPVSGRLTEMGGKLLAKHGSSDIDYILSKVAESAQGGMTLDSKSGEGPKPPSGSAGGNNVRKYLESSEAAVNMKKVDGKGPQKKSLAEVLSEPAMSKSTDSKVHENLSNASKGGVKIAQAKALLQKIAEEGCTCSDKGECKYCKMKAAMKAKKEDKAEGSEKAGN